MTTYRKLFPDELTDLFIDEAGFKQSQFKMPIFYKYASDGAKLVIFIL